MNSNTEAQCAAPFVSFIIAAYKERYFNETIASLINQTCGEWEALVFDGGASWDVGRVVASIGDRRVVYMGLGFGSDVCATWNCGLSSARGLYVCFYGDDDMLGFNFVEEVGRISIGGMRVGLIHTAIVLVDDDGEIVKNGPILPGQESVSCFIFQRLINNRMQALGDFLFNVDMLRSRGGLIFFKSAWCSDEASAFWIANESRVENLPNVSYYWRVHDQSISSIGSQSRNRILASVDYVVWLKAFIVDSDMLRGRPSWFLDELISIRFTRLINAAMGPSFSDFVYLIKIVFSRGKWVSDALDWGAVLNGLVRSYMKQAIRRFEFL